MTATFTVCPMAVVEAPVGVVWRLLTNFAGWGTFLERARALGPAAGAGRRRQKMRVESGPRWLHLGISFGFTWIEVKRKLEMDIGFPFGITVREDLHYVDIDDARCRVHYHCHFQFAAGWRGRSWHDA